MSTIQKHIWAEVAKLDSYIVDIVLDELVRTATDGGIGSPRCETISHIVATLSSINVRGRIYLKLRKVRHMDPILCVCTYYEHFRHWAKFPLSHQTLFQSTNIGTKFRHWFVLPSWSGLNLPTLDKVIYMFQKLSILFRWLLERVIRSSASQFTGSSWTSFSLCISLDLTTGLNLSSCG